MSWTLWDQPFHKKPWHGTVRKPWGNGVEPWEKVVEPWGKRWNREKSSARLWGTLFWLLHRFISGCHQKNHSLYHSSYAWFLAMLPGSYWTSRWGPWGPVTYETSPQEVLGHILHSTLYTPHFTPHILHFTFYTLHSHFTLALSTLHCTLYTPHLTLPTLHFTLHTPHFPLSTPHFTLYTFNSTLDTPHFTLHTSHFLLHMLHFTLHALHSLSPLSQLWFRGSLYVIIRVGLWVRGLHLFFLFFFAILKSRPPWPCLTSSLDCHHEAHHTGAEWQPIATSLHHSGWSIPVSGCLFYLWGIFGPLGPFGTPWDPKIVNKRSSKYWWWVQPKRFSGGLDVMLLSPMQMSKSFKDETRKGPSTVWKSYKLHKQEHAMWNWTTHNLVVFAHTCWSSISQICGFSKRKYVVV